MWLVRGIAAYLCTKIVYFYVVNFYVWPLTEVASFFCCPVYIWTVSPWYTLCCTFMYAQNPDTELRLTLSLFDGVPLIHYSLVTGWKYLATSNKNLFCFLNDLHNNSLTSVTNMQDKNTILKPLFTSTLIVTSHESNTYSMSASFAFCWSCRHRPTQIQVLWKHTCGTNTEQMLLSSDIIHKVLVKQDLCAALKISHWKLIKLVAMSILYILGDFHSEMILK